MAEVDITKQTRWECACCGRCCRSLIVARQKNLSEYKDGILQCRHLKSNMCSIYDKRPMICKIYPLVIDIDKIVGDDGVARPQNAFILENMKIHTECPGFGKGKRIYANSNLIKKFEKIAEEFSVEFKKRFDNKEGFDDLI